MTLDKTSRACHSNCASFHAVLMGRSPCQRDDRQRRRHRSRRRSHGKWLARFAKAVPSWHDSPAGPGFWLAVQRLPSLGRRDNAGAFGRRVLRGLWTAEGRVSVYASNPRALRWLRRMRNAGVVVSRNDRPAWTLADDVQHAIISSTRARFYQIDLHGGHAEELVSLPREGS